MVRTCNSLYQSVLQCIHFKRLIFNDNVRHTLDVNLLKAHQLPNVTESYALGHTLVRGKMREYETKCLYEHVCMCLTSVHSFKQSFAVIVGLQATCV